jgi:hypothetical protein
MAVGRLPAYHPAQKSRVWRRFPAPGESKRQINKLML